VEELYTEDPARHPGYRMPLWHNPKETFIADMGAGERYRLVFVSSGTGILQLGERRTAFNAPALFLLNENERPELQRQKALHAEAFYFHPAIINSVFTLENARNGSDSFSSTEYQDRGWVDPFVQRNQGYFGHLIIGPVTAKQVAFFFQMVSKGLSEKIDDGWPCKTRSYFLQLLFVLYRIWQAPGSSEAETVPDDSASMDSVILYLHTHYHEKITISHLTRLFHTNRTTLESQFVELTGQSILAYLISLRLKVASLMLRDTELPISEIIGRVGFSDTTNFWRAFRKHVGCSPSEYRQQNCWMLH